MGSPQRTPYHTQSSSEDHVSYSSSEAGSLPRETTLATRSRFTRHFTLRQSPSQSSSSSNLNAKGPLGLITVHQPSSGEPATANLVFVHGLGGGSEHTWSKNGVLWPRDLLPEQPPFRKTNVHIFGYDSDFKKSSTLNIHDFSKSLLNNLLNNPVVNQSNVCPPITHTPRSCLGSLAAPETIYYPQLCTSTCTLTIANRGIVSHHSRRP